MRELYYSHLFGFLFFPLIFIYFTKEQEKRKMQAADEPGTRVQIRRDQGDEDQAVHATTVALQAAPGALQASWENVTSPRGSRQQWEDGCPQISGSTTPLSGGHPGQSAGLKTLRAPVFGGLVSKAWAHKGQTKRREGPAQKS